MRRPHHVMLCREGWYLLGLLVFVLAGALLRQINLLLVFYGLLGGPLVFSWFWARRSLKQFEVRRVLPTSVMAGDSFSVRIEARNGRKRFGSWSVVVHDTIVRGRSESGRKETAAEPIHVDLLFSYVPAGHAQASTYRGRLTERGRYRFGPLKATTRFPFGLLRHTVSFDRPEELVVLPRLGQLSRQWRRLQSAAGLEAGQVQRKQGSQGGDFYGLREWRADDNRRWIHWRTSARKQTLIVRQFEQLRNQDLVVIVELWQPDEPLLEHLANVELAVSFAATLVADQSRRGGAAMRLVAAAATSRREEMATIATNPAEAMQRLALAEADIADRLPDVLYDALQGLRPGTSVVLVSTRAIDLSDSERFARSWQDSRQQAWLGRILTVDTSRDELSQFFSLD